MTETMSGAVEERPPPKEGRPERSPPPPQKGAAHARRWTGGRIAAAVIGAVLVLFSLALLGAGGTALWADLTQREGGYVTTGVHEFSSSGSALATVSTELGSAGVGWLYSPDLMDVVRIRVTPTSEEALFVGIGPSRDVERYLEGVNYTEVSEFWEDKVEQVAGSKSPAAPASQGFWVASAVGIGTQDVVWDATDGSWTVVVMNADAQPGIAVGTDLGAKFPALLWVAIGVLVAGAIFLAGGALLVAGALRRESAPI
jgi:hypothetical protein